MGGMRSPLDLSYLEVYCFFFRPLEPPLRAARAPKKPSVKGGTGQDLLCDSVGSTPLALPTCWPSINQ
jgi:hypothetical protein